MKQLMTISSNSQPLCEPLRGSFYPYYIYKYNINNNKNTIIRRLAGMLLDIDFRVGMLRTANLRTLASMDCLAPVDNFLGDTEKTRK